MAVLTHAVSWSVSPGMQMRPTQGGRPHSLRGNDQLQAGSLLSVVLSSDYLERSK